MNRYVAALCVLVSSVGFARADSHLPHNTFEGAEDLGVIDFIGPVREIRDLKMFRCFFTRVGLNYRVPIFSTYYAKFQVRSTKARVLVRMQESPQTTMWLRTYDANRQFLKEYRGNAGETIDEAFAQGTYYLQVLTDANNAHLPDGTNIANITFRGIAGADSSDAPGQTEPINLGNLSPGQPIRHTNALSILQGRSRAWQNPPANCGVGGGADSTPTLYDDRDSFVVTAPAGRIFATINRTFDMQNWTPMVPLKLYYWREGNLGGTWQEVAGSPIDHRGGQLKLHFGSLSAISAYVEDSYAAYDLTLSMQ